MKEDSGRNRIILAAILGSAILAAMAGAAVAPSEKWFVVTLGGGLFAITMPAIVESIDIDPDAEALVPITVNAKSTGVFTISIT